MTISVHPITHYLQEAQMILSEFLEENFNLMILLQLIGGIVQLCIVGYDALVRSTDGDITMILPCFMISSAISCELLIYCYMGECLIKESTVFGEALYLCEWYNISKKEKQLMHICMIRSTKQMSLTSGKFLIVSLTTYTDVSMNLNNYLNIPSLANTNKLDGLPTREHATYNCPCEKHGVLKSKPQTDIVWPWDLLIVIANANLIGN
ncbi:PREDICTED: odorant receptor 13a-like [Polistes dominula]|uniref:Odorant receptor 13a-like n=1 Tax=Polistes dominula TaxID=743375 RepID=A0ABM1IZQ6_POLDO|nr:PREDICTED: odorant receptor 13a-like [Polistes dominula]